MSATASLAFAACRSSTRNPSARNISSWRSASAFAASGPRPMDRLICDDVGYGKTELAIRAAFKTADNGRQVAVLVPTTVLAEQHFRTFGQRLAEYPFVVEGISRFRTAGEQKQILERLRQ